MSSDLDAFLDEAPRRPVAVGGIRALPLGSKIVLAGCVLLFLSLFLTWQNLEIDYGPAGSGTQLLDGWDVFGLLIGMLTLGLLVLVVVLELSDVEVSPDVPWKLVTLIVAAAILGLVAVKNLTDRDSAWASYLGLAFAAAIVVGAVLDWSRARAGFVPRRRRRRVRSAV